MSLSCECDVEDPDWYWRCNNEFSIMPGTRRKRCCSCRDLISPGDDVLTFHRNRLASHDIEISIYGEDGEIELATWYMCEECGGLFLALTEPPLDNKDAHGTVREEIRKITEPPRGFCVDIDQPMKDHVKEYVALTKT